MHVLVFNLATDERDQTLGFTASWIRAVAARVEHVSVLTVRAGEAALPANVSVRSVGKELGRGRLGCVGAFYRHLFAILAERRVDFCFSHMNQIFTVLGAPVLRARHVPIVTWYAHPTANLTLKLAHRLSDRMVTSLASAYPYRRDKLTVLGQGIDMALFAPDGTRPDDPPVVLCVGRLSPVKDHRTLLGAARLLRDRSGAAFRVTILGGPASTRDETYVRQLRDETRRLDLEDVVSFDPPVRREELPARYRTATVHVNLTPAGFGDKVAWESMASGRPCLVANPDFAETLGELAPVLGFRHGDAAHLAERLGWCLAESETERARIGGYLRERVARQHGLERLVDELLSLGAGLRRRRILRGEERRMLRSAS